MNEAYEARTARSGTEIMRHIEKEVMLKMLDQHWREHLAAMDYLRQGIHLRGYAQKDYRFEYKREAFELFAAMLDRVKFETVSFLSKIEIRTAEEIEREEEERRERLMRALQPQHAEAQSVFTVAVGPAAGRRHSGLRSHIRAGAGRGAARWVDGSQCVCLILSPEAQGTFVRGERKVGRNELCPCGSGKKFKHCHGTLTSVE